VAVTRAAGNILLTLGVEPPMRVLPVPVVGAICFALLGCGGESRGERSSQTFTISNGDTATYEPGVARVGDKIVCVMGGERLGGVVVVKPGTGLANLGTGPSGSLEVSVTVGDDGSVVASCNAW
jgi:hypothetical protein